MNSKWVTKCIHWKNLWPQLGLSEFDQKEGEGIDLYKFMEVLNSVLSVRGKTSVVSDAGSAIYVPSQSLQLKKGQRFLLDGAQAGMGAALPMSIGVALSDQDQNVIVITGDGSLQTNIQELATIRAHNLPIKIFVWDNGGYLSIRNTQDAFFGGRRFGTDEENGLFFPNLKLIAEAYDLEYLKCDDQEKLSECIQNSFEHTGPVLIHVKCKIGQKIVPNIAKRDGETCQLDEMAPYLTEKEQKEEAWK